MTKPGSNDSVGLRPSKEDDLEFLYQVYASSRDREMALLVEWSAEQKENFLREQFRLQDRHYKTHYANARYDIIEIDGKPAGRLYVDRMKHEIRLMDIALLTEYRNRGVGRALVQDLLDEADRDRMFVSLHVEDNNPAKRLYERMGFVEVREVSFYKLMHWIPKGLTPKFDEPAELS